MDLDYLENQEPHLHLRALVEYGRYKNMLRQKDQTNGLWSVIHFLETYRTLINDFSSTIYYVDENNGSDSNAGTDVARFATVDKAVETASSGNMIVVYNGTYNNPNTYTSQYDAYYSSVLIDRG